MIALTVLTLLYFLPTVVASQRHHHSGGIFVLNLFFGWTIIGWFALLLWALVSTPRCYCVPVPVYYPHSGWRRY